MKTLTAMLIALLISSTAWGDEIDEAINLGHKFTEAVRNSQIGVWQERRAIFATTYYLKAIALMMKEDRDAKKSIQEMCTNADCISAGRYPHIHMSIR